MTKYDEEVLRSSVRKHNKDTLTGTGTHKTRAKDIHNHSYICALEYWDGSNKTHLSVYITMNYAHNCKYTTIRTQLALWSYGSEIQHFKGDFSEECNTTVPT